LGKSTKFWTEQRFLNYYPSPLSVPSRIVAYGNQEDVRRRRIDNPAKWRLWHHGAKGAHGTMLVNSCTR